MREWYQQEHRNWVPVDGQRSKWWIWNQALDEARKSVRQIQTYLQRLSEGKDYKMLNLVYAFRMLVGMLVAVIAEFGFYSSIFTVFVRRVFDH